MSFRNFISFFKIVFIPRMLVSRIFKTIISRFYIAKMKPKMSTFGAFKLFNITMRPMIKHRWRFCPFHMPRKVFIPLRIAVGNYIPPTSPPMQTADHLYRLCQLAKRVIHFACLV